MSFEMASLTNNLVAVVPVRAGSKGLPGKNIRELNGKPLYLHAVEQALRICDRCIISTDIPSILDESLPTGCISLKRSQALAQDDTPMEAVLDDAIRQLGSLEALPKRMLLLQATSPLRHDSDIKDALKLHETGHYDLVMSVTPADRSILKYGLLNSGSFKPISSIKNCFANRQSLPQPYRPNGAVYVFSIAAFLKHAGLAMPRVGATIMPLERSHDIDTERDFLLAEKVLRLTRTMAD